jgi:hypothetical protein
MSTLHGTGEVDEAKLEKALREVMDLSPRGIREHLNLARPIYARTAAYGHFGRSPTRTAASPGRRPSRSSATTSAASSVPRPFRTSTASFSLEGQFLFASDIEDYVAWTRDHVAAHGGFAEEGDASQPYENWIETRYEAKARREERGSSYLRFRRRG